MTKELREATEIADDPNKYQYSPAVLRQAATTLTDAGMHRSADNIFIHLRLRRDGGRP